MTNSLLNSKWNDMDNQHIQDVFAQIANKRLEYRDRTLVIPEPIPLPDIFVPAATHNPQAVFEPAKKMQSEDELKAELERFRGKYEPFMRNLAPSFNSKRQRHYLSEFDWRIESDHDREDFQTVLAGQGFWKKITLPHYGEPLGKAATYYRTTFNVSKDQLGVGSAFICFKGVDYKAHVFINNTYLGSHESFFAPFEFDFTPYAHVGQNTLVVKVENDFICGSNDTWGSLLSGDKLYAATGLGYDEPYYGWHHCAPGMGIYQDVYIEFRPRLFVNDIFIRPLPKEGRAEAWVEIYSCDYDHKNIAVSLSLFGQNFNQTVFERYTYKPTTPNVIGLNDEFTAAMAKANGTHGKPLDLAVEQGKNYFVIPFEIRDFRWWTLEEPWLYQLQVSVLDQNNCTVDIAARHFGMRSFAVDTENTPKGAILFNSKPIRLHGANTMGHEQQCVFRKNWDQLRDDILLAKICNMNFLRITQRPVQEEVYDYCDMLGLMIQTDLPVFGVIRRNQYCEALRQVREMVELVRPHPCNIMITYINEPFPNAGNKPHRHLTHTELADFYDSADRLAHHLHPDLITKPCDGDYDPPSPGIQDRHCYTMWYNGHGCDFGMLLKGYWQPTKKDWLYACGEFGAEGLDNEEVMRKYYPKDWLPHSPQQEQHWSPGRIFRAQTGSFHYFFFDTPTTLRDWIQASQDHQAWSAKSLTEAFRRDNRMVSFAIHLFIDAWPSGWMKSIMDCDRKPKKAYFAYRNALAPLLPGIRTDRLTFFSGETARFEAWLCNDLHYAADDLTIAYQFESAGKVLFAQQAPARVAVCASTFQGYLDFDLPTVDKRTELTVRIGIKDSKGILINDNYLDFLVFPGIPDLAGAKVCLLKNNGKAAELAKALKLKTSELESNSPGSLTILIDDYESYKSRRIKIDPIVKNGGRVVFIELPCGKYEIGGKVVNVQPVSFNPVNFLSRKTGHRLVSQFEPRDFALWHNPALDRISPLADTTISCDDLIPVLKSGKVSENHWTSAMVSGELKYGKGSFFVNQVNLAGRTDTNPVAKLFAYSLVNGQDRSAV
jgi:hypothetical protein